MAQVFREKHVVPLRPREGPVLQKKKKQFVPLHPRDVAGVPQQACCYSTCHICLISQCVRVYNIVCSSIFGAEIEIVGVADPGTRNISLSM
jgi:hypothetical protein